MSHMDLLWTDHGPTMDRPKLEVPSTHTGIGIIDGMTITLIVLASVLGALARVLAFALFDTPHASIHAILAPNLIGCFLMGILQSCKPRMIAYSEPLFIALTSGFCGSLTSFSTWQTAAAQELFGFRSSLTAFRLGRKFGLIDNISGWLLFLWTGVAAPITAHFSGEHFAASWFRTSDDSPHEETTPAALHPRWLHYSIWIGYVGLVGACVYASLGLSSANPPLSLFSTTLLLDAVFAPFGALLRFYLSRLNNREQPSMPLGTLASNLLGTLISGVVMFVAFFSDRSSSIQCALTSAFSSGFCGCLTTVSSFAFELIALSRLQSNKPVSAVDIELTSAGVEPEVRPAKSGVSIAYLYAFTSIVCAQLILIVLALIFRPMNGAGGLFDLSVSRSRC